MMLLAFLIPLITWCGLGMPTDRISLGILASAILSGMVALIKELIGGKAPTPAPQTP